MVVVTWLIGVCVVSGDASVCFFFFGWVGRIYWMVLLPQALVIWILVSVLVCDCKGLRSISVASGDVCLRSNTGFCFVHGHVSGSCVLMESVLMSNQETVYMVSIFSLLMKGVLSCGAAAISGLPSCLQHLMVAGDVAVLLMVFWGSWSSCFSAALSPVSFKKSSDLKIVTI